MQVKLVKMLSLLAHRHYSRALPCRFESFLLQPTGFSQQPFFELPACLCINCWVAIHTNPVQAALLCRCRQKPQVFYRAFTVTQMSEARDHSAELERSSSGCQWRCTKKEKRSKIKEKKRKIFLWTPHHWALNCILSTGSYDIWERYTFLHIPHNTHKHTL